MNAINLVQPPENEPVLSYLPGSMEKKALKSALEDLKNRVTEIPLIIGGEEIRTGQTGDICLPHDLNTKIGVYYKAGEAETERAIENALAAKQVWETCSWEDRAAVFLKAAELLSTKYRYILNAATMLCQSKNVFQAEIDSACELIDFFNYNVYFMRSIYSEQPRSVKGIWNRTEYRALEGFVFAVTPFNFTSIGGNLPTAPALMGNTVIWKPASTQVYSAYFIMKLLQEAGLPDGVINFLPGSGREIGDRVLKHPDLAGVHFTGSTGTFQHMWRTIGENITSYRTYPRIVGETGGKDFIFAHSSAEEKPLIAALIRGAFEYQGQKCSAASRAYIPASIWERIQEYLVQHTESLKMGSPEDCTNFVNAVIDRKAFQAITAYIDHARESSDADIVAGGEYDDRKGFFIRPTIIVTKDPRFKTMEEEIFGPVLTIYVYPDDKYAETLELCDKTSPFALTGAIFARHRSAIREARRILRHAAGNFYINDKPTGAVVGQQPFGGARASGTNDKAGSAMNLMRWVSVRTIKENFNPADDYRYGFLREA